MSQDISQILTNLGVSGETLADDVLVTDAVALLKCVHPDGSVSLFMGHSDGMSWIERLGMLRAAERLENGSWPDPE